MAGAPVAQFFEPVDLCCQFPDLVEQLAGADTVPHLLTDLQRSALPGAIRSALAKQRAVKAAHLTIDAETLMTRAASVDSVDRQLAAGYRARALKMTQEAAELREPTQPFNLKLK